MRSISEICLSLKNNPVLSKIIPSGVFQTIPIPTICSGKIGVGFYFYLMGGRSNEPKTIFPPVFRVVLDRQTEQVIQLAKAPEIWLGDHECSSVVGQYPSEQLRRLTFDQSDSLYAEYYSITDSLISHSTSADVLVNSPLFSKWFDLYKNLREDGYDPYFATFLPALANRDIHDHATEAYNNTDIVSLKQQSEILLEMLESTKKIVRYLGDEGLKNEWARIRSIFDAPSFSVVVAGEFNRGKTTLLNKLLGLKLPEGDLPTTALLTKIVNGDSPSLIFIEPTGERKRMGFTPENLDSLQADLAGNDPQGVLVVEIPHSWLGDRGIAFIDTPGAGDLSEQRAVIAAEAVMAADAAMITISATMPLSMSERVFIEEHIFTKKVPKVAVVITKLDLVNESERLAVVDNIAFRIKQWQPETEVWLSQRELGSSISVQGIDAMKVRIEHWRLAPEHLALRQKQLSAQLSQLLELASLSVATKINVINLGVEKAAHESERLQRTVDSDVLQWEGLKIDVEKRSLLCYDNFVKQLRDFEKTLREKLSYLLKRSQNPREWWEKDLPFLLVSELKLVHRQLANNLREVIQMDIQFMQDKSLQSFDTKWQSTANSGGILSHIGEPLAIEPDVTKLYDINTLRTWTRAGTTLAGVGGFLLFGPLGAIVPAFAMLAAEQSHRTMHENQVDILIKKIPVLLEEVFGKITEEGKVNIRKVYMDVVNELHRQKQIWLNTKKEAIASQTSCAGDSSNLTTLEDMTATIRKIQSTLSHF